jgi:transcriptional regulator with XRE-family HTH domain
MRRIFSDSDVFVNNKSEVSEGRCYTAPVKTEASAFGAEVATRLKHLREDIKKMSPEEVSAKTDGQVSASYIRRIEKAENSPTIETLDMILRALDSNLGLFFEYQIEQSADVSSRDRRYGRVLQRALESDKRKDAEAMMRVLERSL